MLNNNSFNISAAKLVIIKHKQRMILVHKSRYVTGGRKKSTMWNLWWSKKIHRITFEERIKGGRRKSTLPKFLTELCITKTILIPNHFILTLINYQTETMAKDPTVLPIMVQGQTQGQDRSSPQHQIYAQRSRGQASSSR